MDIPDELSLFSVHVCSLRKEKYFAIAVTANSVHPYPSAHRSKATLRLTKEVTLLINISISFLTFRLLRGEC